MSYENLDIVKKRLEDEDLPFKDFETDPFTNHRTLRIVGPDEVEITFIEI